MKGKGEERDRKANWKDVVYLNGQPLSGSNK